MDYTGHGVSNDFLLFTLVALGMICTTVIVLVRARLANQNKWSGNSTQVPPMFDKMLDRAMQQRDERHRRLRERIEVLEHIVTDSHKSHELVDAIEKLKDQS